MTFWLRPVINRFNPMNVPDPVVVRQLPLIAKIIADETWLEGERRRRPVDPDDGIVRENVCLVVLRMGAEMRRQALREIADERMTRVRISEEPEVNNSRDCAAA